MSLCDRPVPAKGRPLGRFPALVILALILILAGSIRLYRLRDVPAGLFCDEAAIGYNAYSILETGMDEHGVRLPLYVWSFGGYKNPIYIYTAIAPISVLGLDEFSLRLTSVLFGLAAIAAIYLLAAEMTDRLGGLIAALLLAVSYWHIHFSRIAFELISLPPVFMLGFYFFLRGLRKKRAWHWCASAFFFGLCSYAYAPARLQVPLFLLGATLIYLKHILKRKRAFLLAVAVFVLTVFPSVRFSYVNREKAQRYFKTTSIFRRYKDPRRLARAFWNNYRTFYGKGFLFEKLEDPVRRHGVRGFGVYPAFFMPLTLLGLLFIALKREKQMFLVLVWAAIFPVAASLMNEIPSASRSFIGVPLAPLICSYGLYGVFSLVAKLKRKRLAAAIDAAIVVVIGFFAAREIGAYMDEYFNRFPRYASGGIYAFQYGYRDVIGYMEKHRGEYDRLMLTATDVNRPYIFALFYSGIDPTSYIKKKDCGYLILKPGEYGRYPDGRVLYSLREADLRYFSDYGIKKIVRSPDGVVQFVIAEVRKRKNYLRDWMTIGLFDNREGRGANREFIDIDDVDLGESRPGRYGTVRWRPMKSRFVEMDFNRFYAAQPTDRHRGNPEYVCAYAVTYIECPTARDAVLEISGSPDRYSIWLNKKPVVENASLRSRTDIRTFPIALDEGENELLVKTCESVGDWIMLVRLVSPEEKDFDDIRSSRRPCRAARRAPVHLRDSGKHGRVSGDVGLHGGPAGRATGRAEQRKPRQPAP